MPESLKIAPASGFELFAGKPEWCKGCAVDKCTVDPDECKRQAEEKRASRLHKSATALSGINIGARYRGMTFDDYKPASAVAGKVLDTCKRYADTFEVRLSACDNILMLGNPGTGKNMLAACICQSVALQSFSAVHTTAMKLVRKIKESWRKGSDLTEQQAIDQFSLPDLLVIDEVGVQYGSETECILLFEVINERYEAMRPTIIISNLNAAEVEGHLGSRIMDRFYEGKSAVLEFTWESYRRHR